MKIIQDVYWGLDKDDKVIIDKEMIRKEFEHKLSIIVQEKEGFSENTLLSSTAVPRIAVPGTGRRSAFLSPKKLFCVCDLNLACLSMSGKTSSGVFSVKSPRKPRMETAMITNIK